MKVPASGCTITDADKQAMHAAVDAGWLTEGKYTQAFEAGLQEFTGIRQAMLVNSGSSANLIAVAAMVESGRWKAGDLIITVAASFPTTINPLLLYGLIPVFVDIDLDTLNVNVDQLWRATSQHKVKGVMLAHTLGNPFDCGAIADIARQRRLGIVEDCCDALGAKWGGKHVGSFGDIATCSFFPAHHITTGEGGAVFTNDAELAAIARSVRDWGRDCWCVPGVNDTCGKRFEWEFAGLPKGGYDHKYVISRLGFNLKATEIQAALGCSQLRRVEQVVTKRRSNEYQLKQKLLAVDGLKVLDFVDRDYGRYSASPFGYPMFVKDGRTALQKYLTQNGVDSRLVFAGNITRQPYFKGRKYLVAAELRNTDRVMNDALWIGCHDALTEEQLDYAAAKVKTFLGDF